MRLHEILDNHSENLDQYLKWLIDHLKQGGRFDRVMLDHPEDLSLFIGNQAVLSPLIVRALKTKYDMEPEEQHFTDEAKQQFTAAKDHSHVFQLLDRKLKLS
jgi:hypothetical protein